MRMLKICAVAAALSFASVGAALAQSADDLSGRWLGAYWGGGNQATTFDATIVDPEGPEFSGTMVETNTLSAEQVAFLLSRFEGVVEGKSVRFTKTYDGTGGLSHSVSYEGEMESPRRIVGTWRIGETVGQFELVR